MRFNWLNLGVIFYNRAKFWPVQVLTKFTETARLEKGLPFYQGNMKFCNAQRWIVESDSQRRVSGFEIKKNNLSDLETIFLKLVRNWNRVSAASQILTKTITTRQILNWKNFKAQDFQLNFLHRFRLCRKPSKQSKTFRLHLFNKSDKVCIFRAFSKSMVLTLYINNLWVFEGNNLQSAKFCVGKFQSVKFSMKCFTTVQILNRVFYNEFDFELKFMHRFRFCRKLCLQEITSCFVLFSLNEKFFVVFVLFKSLVLSLKNSTCQKVI